MGRKLMRVPLDFDYPLDEVWYGYYINSVTDNCMNSGKDEYCEQCKNFARIKGIRMTDCGCPAMADYFAGTKELQELCAPPKGDGYQLWETTSAGSPVSPVFETLDELCEWCETYATTFADFTATKEEWEQMLRDDFVYAKKGNMFFC
jgi:hypothetical protein